MNNEDDYISNRNSNIDLNQNCDGNTAPPISKDKLNNCYKANGETYPLCKGAKDSKECNLYEDMVESCDNI